MDLQREASMPRHAPPDRQRAASLRSVGVLFRRHEIAPVWRCPWTPESGSGHARAIVQHDAEAHNGTSLAASNMAVPTDMGMRVRWMLEYSRERTTTHDLGRARVPSNPPQAARGGKRARRVPPGVLRLCQGMWLAEVGIGEPQVDDEPLPPPLSRLRRHVPGNSHWQIRSARAFGGQFGGAAMRFACLDFLLVHHIVARLGQYAQPR